MTEPLPFDGIASPRPEGGLSLTCTACKRLMAAEYHLLNGKVICAECRARVQTLSSTHRPLAAPLVRGAATAVVGAGIYVGVLVVTGYQIGLIAVLIGFLVGRAVRQGAGGFSGRREQLLAVVLTYGSIASSNVYWLRNVLWSALKQRDWRGLIWLSGHLLWVPLAQGIQSVTGLIILAVALWEAWRMNARPHAALEGPFKIGRLDGSA